MRTRLFAVATILAGLFLVSSTARAQIETETGWYLTGDAAPAWHEGLNSQASGAIAAIQRKSFKSGVRLSAIAGYRYNTWIAGELETGFLYHGVWDNDRTGDAADLFRIPFMINVVATWRDDRIVTPYAGVGIGAMANILNGTLDIGATRLSGTSFDLALAYQGFVGLKFALGEHSEFNVNYKVVGSLGPEYSFGSPAGNVKLNFVKTLTHSFGFGWSYNF